MDTGSISGTVSVDGQPVADAVVMITGASPTHHDLAALTGSDGRYRLEDLTPGNYTILVNVEGITPQTRPVEVQPGQEAVLNVALSARET
jgi:hypothetical protein